MEFKSDWGLKGQEWIDALNKSEKIFQDRKNYSLFVLATAIGICYDKQIESLEGDHAGAVPRLVLVNNSGILDMMYQTVVLTSKYIVMTDEQRMDVAFSEKNAKDVYDCLIKYANYGVKKILDQLTDDDTETMDNLLSFLERTKSGTNFDISELDIEDLL